MSGKNEKSAAPKAVKPYELSSRDYDNGTTVKVMTDDVSVWKEESKTPPKKPEAPAK